MIRLLKYIIITLLIIFFSNTTVNAEEIIIPAIPDQDYELLANLINAEGGQSNYVSDDMCYYIGSVVLNRVADDRFPDTIHDVIYQKGQYACIWDGNFQKPVNDRSYEIAYQLLAYGSVLPKEVIWQAQFKQGNGVYIKEQNMYFCY